MGAPAGAILRTPKGHWQGIPRPAAQGPETCVAFLIARVLDIAGNPLRRNERAVRHAAARSDPVSLMQ
jgi:hypothetical protein